MVEVRLTSRTEADLAGIADYVFYLVDESGILIVRILHSSMDSARHFSGS